MNYLSIWLLNDTEVTAPNKQATESLDPQQIQSTEGFRSSEDDTEGQNISLSQPEKQVADSSGGTAGHHIPHNQPPPARQVAGLSAGRSTQPAKASTKEQHIPLNQLEKQVAAHSALQPHTATLPRITLPPSPARSQGTAARTFSRIPSPPTRRGASLGARHLPSAQRRKRPRMLLPRPRGPRKGAGPGAPTAPMLSHQDMVARRAARLARPARYCI